MGNGYPTIEALLNPNFYFLTDAHEELHKATPILLALIGLALVKLIATSITVGSGGAGGLFAPSLMIGAATGGAVGYAFPCDWLVSWNFPSILRPCRYGCVGISNNSRTIDRDFNRIRSNTKLRIDLATYVCSRRKHNRIEVHVPRKCLYL